MGAAIQPLISKALQIIKQLRKTSTNLKLQISTLLKTFLPKVLKNLKSFYAFHSPLKMDRIDYTFKFSTELIVAALSLIMVVISATSGNTGLANADTKNLFERELSYRPATNEQLYNKNTSIRTVVTAGNGLIASASAQVVLASDQFTDPQSDPAGKTQDSIISNNAIVADDVDNIRGAIANQIQSYPVQSGDTLAGLAQKFGISINTIVWANNLSAGSTLKPGETLTILPVDGIIHKVTNNDTLPDIAKAFHADINQIISFNGLADDQDINPGDLIIIPGGIVPAPPKPSAPPTPVVKHVVKGKTVYEPVVNLAPGSGHLFPGGQCTYYVAFRRAALGEAVSWGGNAKAWLANAEAAGVQTGSTPTPGAIVVTNESRRYGHVALVEAIQGDQILVSEMNFYKKWEIDQRLIKIGSGVIRGYIY